MEKSEFVKKLEKIIDMVKTEDDGFEYGGKVIFHKEDDSNYEVSVMNKVIDVRNKIDHMNHLRFLFVKEYLPLVDHDTNTAMTFFKKAYDVDDDTERYIREGIKDYPLFNNNID